MTKMSHAIDATTARMPRTPRPWLSATFAAITAVYSTATIRSLRQRRYAGVSVTPHAYQSGPALAGRFAPRGVGFTGRTRTWPLRGLVSHT